MKYAVLLALLGVGQIALAFQSGVWWILLVWSGMSFLAAGVAYGWIGPGLFGKRPNGTLPWWRVLVFFPYFGLTWALWHLQRLLTREPACNEVAPGLWLGRRPFAHEIPSGVTLVVDLTAEFPEPKNVVSRFEYHCVPTLDAAAPDRTLFFAAIRKVLANKGDSYIHCALGHGRSATLVAAVLLAKGVVKDVAHAEELVASARPAIAIASAQRHLLTTMGSSLK
jgi:protein-tyrosine phosphatase